MIYLLISFIPLIMCVITFDNPNSGGFYTNFLRFTLLISPILCFLSIKILFDNELWYEPIMIILLNISLFILSYQLFITFNKGIF